MKNTIIVGMEMSFSNEEKRKIITDQRFSGSVVSCGSEDLSTGDIDDCSIEALLDFRKEHPLDMEMEFIECLQTGSALHEDGQMAVSAQMDWEADSLYFQSRNISSTEWDMTEKANSLQVNQSIPSSHGSAMIPNYIPTCDGEDALLRWVDSELES
uniref:Uncharacterized protein n=1 Tax=Ditylum brightwellii TaxID=49249 RepID=A0A7S4QJT5_9STRA